MSPDVALVSETLSRDDITDVQAIDPPLKSIITLPVGDTVDNYQLALMPNMTDTKDIFLIKTANTGTGNVEIDSLTAASDYTSYHVQAGRRFPRPTCTNSSCWPITATCSVSKPWRRGPGASMCVRRALFPLLESTAPTPPRLNVAVVGYS